MNIDISHFILVLLGPYAALKSRDDVFVISFYRGFQVAFVAHEWPLLFRLNERPLSKLRDLRIVFFQMPGPPGMLGDVKNPGGDISRNDPPFSSFSNYEFVVERRG